MSYEKNFNEMLGRANAVAPALANHIRDREEEKERDEKG